MNSSNYIEELINKLYSTHTLTKEEMLTLITDVTPEGTEKLKQYAMEERYQYYNNKVYMRGLIELTNYCKRNCQYCGIRASNSKAVRYRLTKEDVLECTQTGYRLGYRTFVMQGGEDPYYTQEVMLDIIQTVRKAYPDCAITLSLGEKTYEEYKAYFDAGADRYLLRHETYNKALYESLHPGMSFENRIRCLRDLKAIGYETGTGFMVGLPGQTDSDFVEDLFFLKELEPHMVGIGPFMPHQDTPLRDCPSGTTTKTTLLLAMIRLLLPEVLLPATTSLGSVDPTGREQGLLAGANVVMPNLSPLQVRKKYALYDGKVGTGDEAAEGKKLIMEKISKIGLVVDMGKGSHVRRE